MKKISLLLLFLAVIFSGNLSAQSQKELNQLMRERNEYYFTLQVQDVKDIQSINDLCSVDKTDGKTVICYANQQQYDRLIKAGYQPTLQTPPSMLEEAKMWDGNRATYEWDSYPTYSQYESMMTSFPTLALDDRSCTLIELGTLSSGRKILGVRLNNGNTTGKPKFLYSSTIHGDETTGWILMLRLIDELCTSTDSRILNLINNLDIFIFPNANPDGTYYGGNSTVTGARRYNANGVDMNRNYPDPHSSEHPDGNAYQSETQWFMQLAETYPFVMAANYHGGSEVMNYPWDNTTTRHADDAWWQYISREYASLAQAVSSSYMTDENNGITNGADWYTIGGGRQDYMNGYRQCREITIECSTTKNPSASQLPNFWNYNHNAMLTYMEECLNGIHGIVYDASTNQRLEGATITVQNHDDEYSIVSSHEDGDYHRPIKGGNWTLKVSKDGYCTETINVTVSDGQRVDLDVYLTPTGSCVVPMVCYEQVMPSASGSYVMGYFNGSPIILPSHNNSSSMTTTSVPVTITDNGFTVEEESAPATVTLTAYGSNGQYYISYNGMYLSRSMSTMLTWNTTQTQTANGRWYINADGIYVTSNNRNYYLYYNNNTFALSTSIQNNIKFFVQGDCPTVEYNITATAYPTEGGTVTGVGTYEEGANCTLTAIPEEGYQFVNWTVNNNEVSTDAEYTFTVSQDLAIVANFEEIPAETLHWTASIDGYADYTPLTAIIQIDGEEQFTDALEVGVFVGEECRASAIGVLTPFNNHYILNLVIYGNQDESFSFRLYDHETDAELTPELNAPASISYLEDGYGTPMEPYVLNFTSYVSTIDHDFSLSTGWNWWSTYIEMNGVNGLALLEDKLGTSGIQIKSQTSFVTYDQGWFGTLNSIVNEQSYRINMSEPGDFTLTGTLADPETHPITINTGWNWIGFVENSPMDLQTAFGNFSNKSADDIVKTYNNFSTYYEGYGWWGNLDNMQPGQGYMYKAAAAGTLTYPTVAKGNTAFHGNSTPTHWTPVQGKFPDNMSVIAVVELNGNELRNDAEIGAFCQGECRGAAKLMYVEPIDRYVAFLTVFGQDDDMISLQLLNDGQVSAINEHLSMKADDVIGSGQQPMVMTSKGCTGLDEAQPSLGLFPNPSQKGQEVRIDLAGDADGILVELFDVMGRSVYRAELVGNTIPAPETSGVYTLRITDKQGNNSYAKLIAQ